MAENRVSSPPPVLDCARVLHYVIIDKSIEFSGRSLLFVAGEELGAVPCLAICEEKKNGGVLLFHCTDDWKRVGLLGPQVSFRSTGAYRAHLQRRIQSMGRCKYFAKSC